MRITSPALIAALTAEQVIGCHLVTLSLDSGPLRLTDAGQDITFDADGDSTAETFLAVGALGEVSAVEEDTELSSNPIDLTLAATEPALLSAALSEPVQNRGLSIWLAVFDLANPLSVIGVVSLYRGRIDTMEVRGGSRQEIRLRAVDRLVDWERARVDRYTDDDQRRRYPQDVLFKHVDQAATVEIDWGQPGANGSAPDLPVLVIPADEGSGGPD